MAVYHPQIVHFAIALLAVGVLFRALSLFGRPAFVGPAALTLLLLGTAAAALAVNSGGAASGPVEQVPGLRASVSEHERWGERTRTVFAVVIAIEAIGLLLLRSPKRRYVHLVSTAVGLVGLVCLYETGEHGARLVYSYAGGIGIRSGDPADVERLLLAGLYQQAVIERRNGRLAEAGALLAQAGQRFPHDPEVQLAAAESLLLDRKDAQGALSQLKGIAPPAGNRALRLRHGLLTVDALEALGQRDGAAAVVQGLMIDFPDFPKLKQRLDALRSPAPQ